MLDEPTNDLDVETLELLEELLQNYSGTVFLVSHDRSFLDQVVTGVIGYEGDAIWRPYVGGYEDWLRQRQHKAPSAGPTDPNRKSGQAAKPLSKGSQAMPSEKDAPPSAAVSAKATRPLRLNSKEKQELVAIPDRITALEHEQAQISAQLADPETYKTDGLRVAQLQARFQEIELLNEALLLRWEDLLGREEISR